MPRTIGREQKIVMVASAIEKLLTVLRNTYPTNTLIRKYCKQTAAANLGAPMLVYDMYVDNVYRKYRRAINARNIDHLLSPGAIDELSESTGADNSLIEIFIDIWDNADCAIRKYVFDVLISVNKIIKSM